MGSLDLIFDYFRNFWNHSGDFRMGLEIISSVPLNTYDHFGKILVKFLLTQSDLWYSLIVSDVIQDLPVIGCDPGFTGERILRWKLKLFGSNMTVNTRKMRVTYTPAIRNIMRQERYFSRMMTMWIRISNGPDFIIGKIRNGFNRFRGRSFKISSAILTNPEPPTP